MTMPVPLSDIEQSSAQPRLPAVPEEQINDRKFILIGFTIILIIFFGFGTWAALAPLASAAHAPGKVRVESNRKTVQHLEGGIVKTLPVKDGDHVDQGQIVMTLDDTQVRSQLEVFQGKYILTLARKARLVAQRDQLESVVYPDEFSVLQADSRVREVIAVQNQIFNVRKSAYENELALYEQQVEQLNAQLKGFTAQKRSSQHLVNSYTAELNNIKKLETKGYIESRKVHEMLRDVAQSEGALGELMATIAATQSKIVESKLQSLLLQKELQREVATSLNKVQEELFQLIEQRQALQDTLTRTVIKAPQAGTVLGLTVHTIGAIIGNGEKLMDIIPEDKRLIIEAKVSPTDIDKIKVGQAADIRFSAFKMRDTPNIQGKLITISADSIIDPNDPAQMPYYLAIIEISPEGAQHLSNNDLILIAGMPTEIFIKTGERTLLQYLFDPFINTVARSFIED